MIGEFEASTIDAHAFKDKAMKDGELTQEYKDAVRGASEAKITSMIGTTKGYGGADRQSDFAEASAQIKSATDAKVLSENLVEAGRGSGMTKSNADSFGKEAGEAFNRTVQKMADTAGTMAAGKMRSDIRSIDSVGRETYVENQAKSSVGKTQTLDRTLAGEKTGGKTNNDGTLTRSAKEAIKQEASEKAVESNKRASEFNDHAGNAKLFNDAIGKAKEAEYSKAIMKGKTPQEAEKLAFNKEQEMRETLTAPKWDEDGEIWSKDYAKDENGNFKALESGSVLGGVHLITTSRNPISL